MNNYIKENDSNIEKLVKLIELNGDCGMLDCKYCPLNLGNANKRRDGCGFDYAGSDRVFFFRAQKAKQIIREML